MTNLPNIQKYFRFLLASVIIAFPIAAMPNMFYFLGSTLHPTDFPKSWYQASIALEKTPITPQVSSFLQDCTYAQNLRSKKCYDTLALPWHLYISFNFTSSSIVNPMMPFFSRYRVLQGDNIEAGEQLYSQSTKPESKIIENYIGPNGLFPTMRSTSREVYASFIQDIKGLGIQFIILPDPHRWTYEDELLKTGVLFDFLKPIFQESDMKVYLLK